MDAIGFIETRGLIPAIEAADVMLKSAQVGLVERSIVGGGIVTVTVTGDVGAVKAAVDAGASAVQGFGSENLLSQHVIPRPSEQVSDVIFEEKQMPVISQEQDSADAEKKYFQNRRQKSWKRIWNKNQKLNLNQNLTYLKSSSQK